ATGVRITLLVLIRAARNLEQRLPVRRHRQAAVLTERKLLKSPASFPPAVQIEPPSPPQGLHAGFATSRAPMQKSYPHSPAGRSSASLPSEGSLGPATRPLPRTWPLPRKLQVPTGPDSAAALSHGK